MRKKELLYIVAFIGVITIALAATLWQQSDSSPSEDMSATLPTGLVQLAEEGRENAATMGLLNAPPMQHISHVNRWSPELHHESCLACHGKEGTGAPTPPEDHFYDSDPKGVIYRDNCVQCHAQQNDTKTAFNE
jgi:nitrate reductase (cytochrome), electron transfer subunit